MVNRIISYWVANPILKRGRSYIFVKFGLIIGIVTAIGVFSLLSLAVRIDRPEYLDFFYAWLFWWPFAAVIGSIVLFQDFWFQLKDSLKKVFNGGFYEWHRPPAVFYGGFLGSVFLMAYLAVEYKVSVLYALDLVVVVFPIFHGLARLGCLNFGCCYGKPCSHKALFKVSYHHPSSLPVRHGHGVGVDRHPVQLYELTLCLLLGFGLYQVIGKVHLGQVLALYMVGYGIIRFILEMVRDNSHERVMSGVSIWQMLSLLFIAAGVALWCWLPDLPGPVLVERPLQLNVFSALALSLWAGLALSIGFGLHFRQPGEAL